MRALLIAFLFLGCTRPNPANTMLFPRVGGSGTPTGVDCAAQNDCAGCCISAHPAGHDSWVDTVRLCECSALASGSCAQLCAASFCGGQIPDTLCNACLQNDLANDICSLTSS